MKVISLKGQVVNGCRHFIRRMKDYSEVFHQATGEILFPGTLNIKVDKEIPIKEHFRIHGANINEPEQDLLFEICRINGIWAYRIRPYHLTSSGGGHGDDILEIACSKEILGATCGSFHEITLFRDDIKS